MQSQLIIDSNYVITLNQSKWHDTTNPTLCLIFSHVFLLDLRTGLVQGTNLNEKNYSIMSHSLLPFPRVFFNIIIILIQFSIQSGCKRAAGICGSDQGRKKACLGKGQLSFMLEKSGPEVPTSDV